MVGKNRHIVCMLFIILIEVNPINVFGYERDTLCLLAGRKAKIWERYVPKKIYRKRWGIEVLL